MKYSALISSQKIMAAVHIFISGEMAGFKIVPFIATHVKIKKKKNSWSYEKKNSANQNSPICMKTTDIKSYRTLSSIVWDTLIHALV